MPAALKTQEPRRTAAIGRRPGVGTGRFGWRASSNTPARPGHPGSGSRQWDHAPPAPRSRPSEARRTTDLASLGDASAYGWQQAPAPLRTKDRWVPDRPATAGPALDLNRPADHSMKTIEAAPFARRHVGMPGRKRLGHRRQEPNCEGPNPRSVAGRTRIPARPRVNPAAGSGTSAETQERNRRCMIRCGRHPTNRSNGPTAHRRWAGSDGQVPRRKTARTTATDGGT